MANRATASGSAKPLEQPRQDSAILIAQKNAIRASLQAITIEPDGKRTVDYDLFRTTLFKDSSQLEKWNLSKIVHIFYSGCMTKTHAVLEAEMLETLNRSKTMDKVLGTSALFGKVLSFAGTAKHYVFSTKADREKPHAAKFTKDSLTSSAKEILRSKKSVTYNDLQGLYKHLGLKTPAEALSLCVNAEALIFYDLSEATIIALAEHAQGLKKVSKLVIRGHALSFDLVPRFKRKSITSVELYGFKFTPKKLEQLAKDFPLLESIDLGMNPLEYVTLVELKGFINLQQLRLPSKWRAPAPDEFKRFLESIPKLKDITIRSNPNMTDDHLALIATAYPELETLDIWHCVNITAEGIERLINSCPKLNYLNLLGGAIPDADRQALTDRVRKRAKKEEPAKKPAQVSSAAALPPASASAASSSSAAAGETPGAPEEQLSLEAAYLNSLLDSTAQDALIAQRLQEEFDREEREARGAQEAADLDFARQFAANTTYASSLPSASAAASASASSSSSSASSSSPRSFYTTGTARRALDFSPTTHSSSAEPALPSPAYSSRSSSSSSSSAFGSGAAAPAFSLSAAASSSSSASLRSAEEERARRELEELERDGF